MAIRFKGDMTKVVAKNKGDMTKTSLRKREAIIQQIINGTATITPAADYYTKMLLHFDDSITVSNGGTISSVFAPMRGVASPDGTKVYMGTWGSTSTGNGVHVIDVATNTKTTTVSTPGTTLGFTINSTGTRVYAAQYGTTSSNNSGTNVYVINTTNNTLAATVPVGTGAHSLAITPDDKFVYVACDTSGGLYRIDTATNIATSMSIATGLWATVISPDGTKLLFSNGSNVYVYSINTTTGALTYVSTLTGFSGVYTSTKNDNYAYFLDNGASSVIPVSWSTLQKEATITVGGGPYGGSVSADGKKLFVSNNSGNSVSVIDTASNKVIDTITGYSSPRGAVFAGNKLFVANNGAGNVPVVDMRTFSDSALSPMLQNKAGTSVLTSTTQSKFGGKSLALNGTNTNKLQFANPKGKAMDFANKPFCVEGWFYLTSGNFSGNAGLISWANTDNGDCQGIHIDLNSSNRFEVFMSTNGSNWDLGSPTITTSVSPTLNTWFHLALIRETTGGDIKLVHNGTVIGTKVTTSSLYTGDYLYVAKTNYQNITKINGYVDDVRVVVGSCPYSASAFVVPTAELTAITNTKLLLKGANVTKDDSSLNLYTQALGSASSSTVQSKFGGSSIKIASATGDFIKVYNNVQPIAFLDRPFTIEGWFWLNATNSSVFQPLISMRNGGRWDGPIIYIESDNTLKALFSNEGTAWDNTIATGFTPSAQAWHHIALVREYTAGPVKLYCDGVLRGTANTTSSIFVNDTIFIGHDPWFVTANRTLNGYIDEVRITLDYCAYNGNFTPAAAPFTDGKNCLLHFEGTNGSTTFTDSSTLPKTFIAYGTGTAISTTKSKFGSSSLYLPGGRGSGTRVAATSSDFAVGSGDFTIEYWFNMSAMSTGHVGTYFNSMIDTRVSSQNGHIICTNSANKLMLVADGSIYLTCNTAIQLNTWYHVAVSRKGNKVCAYLNGVLDGSATVSFNLAQGGLMLGNVFDYSAAPGIEFNGYIDEVRFTKGTALYYISSYGNFTVPTSEFSDGKNLLMHFNGANGSTTMTDSSTSAKAATAYSGAVISTTQSKFGGSSLYLPGNPGNMVTVSNSSDFAFGTGDFTVEYWMNISAMSAGYSGYHNCMFDTRSAGNNGLFFFMNSSRQIRAYACGSFFMTSTGTVPMNEWVNIAFVRKEGVFYLYINGVLDTTVSASLNMTENKLTIGCNYEGSTFNGIQFNGYIDEFRVTKGEALYYGSDYVVPTTPFTLIG